VPATATSRRRAPCATASVAITSGDSRTTPGTRRRTASASSSVKSLGTPGTVPTKPEVSVLPGKTISRFEPMLANWFVT
jgi:hypothetical protein